MARRRAADGHPLEPYEVFRQEKEGDPMRHGGNVMAPDARLATKALTFESCHAGADAGGIQILLQDRRTASTAAFLVAAPAFSGSCLVSLSGNGGGSGRGAALDPATSAIVVDEGSSG